MLCFVKNLPIQHIFTKKVLNKTTGEPSEYAFQAVFTSILKQLLGQSYSNHFYHALPEVKEYDDDSGDPHLRLDILLKDGLLMGTNLSLLQPKECLINMSNVPNIIQSFIIATPCIWSISVILMVLD